MELYAIGVAYQSGFYMDSLRLGVIKEFVPPEDRLLEVRRAFSFSVLFSLLRSGMKC